MIDCVANRLDLQPAAEVHMYSAAGLVPIFYISLFPFPVQKGMNSLSHMLYLDHDIFWMGLLSYFIEESRHSAVLSALGFPGLGGRWQEKPVH